MSRSRILRYIHHLRLQSSTVSNTRYVLPKKHTTAFTRGYASQAVNSAKFGSERPTDDKYELFVHPDVQQLLQQLTHVDPKKVLPDYTTLTKSREVTLMTQEQLEQAEKQALKTAIERTSMPPVLPVREECGQVLSVDREVEGFSKNSYVFIDTTLGLPERERNITVRSPDGTLSKASWKIRDRMMQVYYPRSGRQIKPAPLLSGENMMRLLNEKKYVYLLDHACCQYEPDHPDYIAITQRVYDHCDANASYNKLISTRHYGPMIFTFILHKQILNVLRHLLKAKRIDDCISIAKIYAMVWEVELPADITPSSDSECISYLKKFMEHEGMMDRDLEHRLNVLIAKARDAESGIEGSAEDEVEGEDNSDNSDLDSSDSDSDSDSDDEDSRKS